MRCKLIFPLLFPLITISCRNSDNNSLKVDDLSFSEFWFNPNDSTGDFSLYLHKYIRINKGGDADFMIQEEYSKKYYTCKISPYLKDLLNTTFAQTKYDSSYADMDDGSIYCGPSYFIYYTINGQTNFIDFVPPDSPAMIKRVSESLDSVFLRTDKITSTPFETKQCEAEISEIHRRIHPLPKMEKPLIKE